MSISCWSDGWTSTAGAKAVAEVGHADCSESWGMEMMHVFQLEGGQYAVVHESGCSCYDSNDADIELLPFAIAFEKYIRYKKDNGLEFTNLEYLEFKSQEKENELLNRNKSTPSA